MSVVLPMSGWRYDQNQVSLPGVIAPSSAEIDGALRLELYKADDRNIIRLLAPESWPSSAAHLDAWREDGLFVQDREAVYVVELEYESGGRSHLRRGIIAKLLLADSEGEESPVVDRIRAVRGNLEPVVGLFDSERSGDALFERYCAGEPAIEVAGRNDVIHRIWIVSSATDTEEIVNGIQQVEITGGRDIYNAAVCYRDEVRESIVNAGRPEPEAGSLDCDYVMAFLTPAGEGDVAKGVCTSPTPVSGLVFYLFW